MFFYFLIKWLSTRCMCLQKVTSVLKSKIFYSAWIRYFIQSYLIILHTVVFFALLKPSFLNATEGTVTVFQFLVATFLVLVWPTIIIWSLLRNRDRLDDNDFKGRFGSLYQGIWTDKPSEFLYNFFFCIRRLLLVIGLVCLRTHGLYLSYSFLVV